MQNFVNFLIEQQNKILGTKSNSRANSIAFGATLCLNTQTEKTKNKLENDIKIILKKCNNNPEKLIKFIEAKGTKVYRFKNAQKLFGSVSQEIGFVPETAGLRAMALNLIINHKPATHTKAMFIVDKDECDAFWFIQQFYKWYAMKLGMKGYDAKSQEAFNGFLYNNSDAKVKSLSVDEILDIKDAIARDVESINFVMELAKATVDSKSASSKITSGGALI